MQERTEVDISSFTSGENKKALIHYRIREGTDMLVIIDGDDESFVGLTLRQIAWAGRMNDPVFIRLANSFGITPQLLQSVIITEYLRISSQ